MEISVEFYESYEFPTCISGKPPITKSTKIWGWGGGGREGQKKVHKTRPEASLPGMEDLTLLIFALPTHFQLKWQKAKFAITAHSCHFTKELKISFSGSDGSAT